MTIYNLTENYNLYLRDSVATRRERLASEIQSEGYGHSGKEIALLREDVRETCQEKETIIYFDKLGFGWVLDPMVLKDVSSGIFGDDEISNKSLMKIIENILAENAGFL